MPKLLGNSNALLCAAFALSCAHAHAQVTITASTAQAWSADAQIDATRRTGSLASALPIPPAREVVAEVRTAAASAFARSSASLSGAALSLDTAATVIRGSSRVSSGVEFRLASPTLRPGYLNVSTWGSRFSSSPSAAMTIRSGSKTLFSWTTPSGSGTDTRRIPILLEAGVPQSIVVSTVANANSPGSCFLRATVTFVAAPCSATQYGDGCGQTTRALFPQARVLEIRGQNSVSNGFGIAFLGRTKQKTPTPFPGCYLYHDAFLALAPYTSDASGSYAQTIPIPAMDLRFLIQGVQFDAMLRDVRFSDAFDVACLR